VADRVPRDWSADDLDTLRDLAAITSSELQLRDAQADAAVAERSARQAQQDAQLLLDLSEAFAAATTPAGIESAIATATRTNLGTAAARLAVISAAGRQIRYVSTGPDLAGGAPASVAALSDDLPIAAVARSGRAQFYRTAAELRREYPMLSADQDLAGACLLLPVWLAMDVVAVVCLRWAEPREFDHWLAAATQAMGAFVAHALERVWLLEARHAVAATLQSALLTPVPQLAGLEVGTAYAPALQTDSVGGDWYDAIPLDRDTTLLVVGDVAGHDMRAAANMGQLRAMLRALAWADRVASPAALLAALDRVNSQLGPGTEATAVVVRVERDASTGRCTLTWANAGHPNPLVLRADGAVEELADHHDFVLGLVPEAPRVDNTGELGPGDTLLLFSDGLIETRQKGLAERLAELRAALAVNRHTPTLNLPNALVEALVPTPQQDDVAVLAVRSRAAEPMSAQSDHRPMPVRHAHREIADDVADLAPTRRWLDDILEADGVAEQLRATATLLANELVTNAVRHACEPISASVQLDPNAAVLRFSVSDGSPEQPVLRYPEPQETSGRGVQLVARLAIRWGVDQHPEGKSVWFELPLRRG